VRWPSLRLHRAEPLSRLLEVHRQAHLAAAFTPGRECECEYHRRWIDAAEHGATAQEASDYAAEHLTGLT
jgi:hypothetical protein